MKVKTTTQRFIQALVPFAGWPRTPLLKCQLYVALCGPDGKRIRSFKPQPVSFSPIPGENAMHSSDDVTFHSCGCEDPITHLDVVDEDGDVTEMLDQKLCSIPLQQSIVLGPGDTLKIRLILKSEPTPIQIPLTKSTPSNAPQPLDCTGVEGLKGKISLR